MRWNVGQAGTVMSDSDSGLGVPEELAPRGIRDEIIWSLYANLD
jgi:hypothetical protein